MKKILISLSVVAAVAAAVVVGTTALFSDTETSAGNIFTAGSIDLKVDHLAQSYDGVDCKTCSVAIQSDTSDRVTGTVGGIDTGIPHNAVLVSLPLNPAWTASIPGVRWIWWTDPTPEAEKNIDTTYTFQKTFVWMGPISGATLALAAAADNGYEVRLNGFLIGSDPSEQNYNAAGQDLYTGFSAAIVQGTNTLEIKVKNMLRPAGQTWDNPGGLLYKLTINGNCGAAYFQNHCELWQSTDLDGSQQFFNFGDVKPGDYGTNLISLHVDSNDAYACLLTSNEDDQDNTLVDPEVALGDTVPAGELSQFVKVFAWDDTDNDGVYEGEAQLLAPNTPIANLNLLNLSLASGGTKYVGLAWCAGTQSVVGNIISCNGATMSNIAQTDSFTADLTAYAVQQRNNPGFNCTDVVLPTPTP